MRLLPLTEVLNLVPVSKPTLYSLMRKKKFPLPVKVGARSFWKSADIEQWMKNKPTPNLPKKQSRKK